MLRHADGLDRPLGGVPGFAAAEPAQAGAGVHEVPAGHPLVKGVLLGTQADASD